ncbi:hypothetical protein CC86DRAFT_409211 [Ophiobolus disseminans]|uniref:Uncharacterized protein n=1 Tax=Ophiobolus disseminans TaxID=1469910 RepID=A0A6A6ZRQ1_9PLEO|nr:hypothetical protein CC86DRAFT_409211 [Ophiobolus disseminans]
MSEMQTRHQRRAEDFSRIMFYTISSRALENSALNVGVTGKKGNTVQIGNTADTSSENWQFFLQSDRYFIRNFDRGAEMQLGLSETDKLVPKLYPQSGNISQQWNLTRSGNYWHMSNGLEPGVVLIMGSGKAVQMQGDAPDLNKDWQIQENPSAATAQPLTGSWTTFLSNFVSPTPSPSASSSASATSTSISTTTNAPSPSNTSPSSSASTNTASSATTSSSSSISPGAIAGIAIAAVVLIGGAAFVLWFFLVKRRRPAPPVYAHEDPYTHADPYATPGSTPPAVPEKYAYTPELASPPVELPAGEMRSGRSELASPVWSSGK